MENLEDITIQSEEEYYNAINIIKACDNNINVAYSEMEKVTDEVLITELQQYINSLNIKRLGLNKLVMYYEDSVSDKKKDKVIYKARMGDTLPLIAQAFYGKSEYAEYLYEHNQLDTMNLEVNQEIEIIEIHPTNPDVFALYQINNLENYNILFGE